MLVNHAGKFRHVFASLEDQLQPSRCCMHSDSDTCDPLAGESVVDLLVTGSPCDPFSKMRCKRFRTDDVKNHVDYGTTMRHVVDMYMKFEPRVGILEQVLGFSMPFTAGGTETPMQRPALVQALQARFPYRPRCRSCRLWHMQLQVSHA